MIGYTKAIDKASALLSTEQQLSLHENDNYNPQDTDMINWLDEGIQHNQNLSGIEVEFNVEINAEFDTEIKDTILEDLFISSTGHERGKGTVGAGSGGTKIEDGFGGTPTRAIMAKAEAQDNIESLISLD